MNYAATAKKAAATLKKAGTSMVLRVTTPGTFDPVAGTETGETVTDYACSGVMTNIKNFMIDGTRILAGDKLVLMGADVAVTPTAGHMLIIAGKIWQVIDNDLVAPDGTNILHKVQVRRG